MIPGKEKAGGRAGIFVKTARQIILILFTAGSILLLLLHSYAAADVFQYVDDQQVIHLTNVPAGPEYQVLIREEPLNLHSAMPVSDRALYNALIMETAAKYKVDSDLVRAIIKVESNFNHKAVSRKGAKGLMQLMPQTASMLGVDDCFRPETNIDGGIRLLSYLIGLYSRNLTLVLAAYNAGERTVAKYGGIPPYAETRTYVRLVLDKYEQYKNMSKTVANANM